MGTLGYFESYVSQLEKVAERNNPEEIYGYISNQENNFAAIKDLHRQIDFNLLLNEHVKIQKGTEAIFVVGVENCGKKFG